MIMLSFLGCRHANRCFAAGLKRVLLTVGQNQKSEGTRRGLVCVILTTPLHPNSSYIN